MKNEILLINPAKYTGSKDKSFPETSSLILPIGLLYIGTELKRNGFDVEIIDLTIKEIELNEIILKIKKEKPLIIGITATISSINNAIKIARLIKNKKIKSRVVIGGAHLCSLYNETMELGVFDIGVIGEGERTFLELAERIRSGNPIKDIKGIIFKEGNKIIKTPPRRFIDKLDVFDIDYSLVSPIDQYTPVLASYKYLPVGYLITSRGCPFKCRFCDKSVFGEKVRYHSVGYVINKIEDLIQNYGIKEIRFLDDNFTLDKKRVLEICEEMKKRGIKVPWSCTTRVDLVSKDLLKKMSIAGCWQIVYGLESGNQEILDKCSKGITIKQSVAAVQWTKEAGINIRAFFIIGMPGENIGTINNTIKFAKSLDIDVATFFSASLYPGSPMSKELINEKNQYKNKDDFIFIDSLENIDKRLSEINNLSKTEIKRRIMRAYREFYLRPRYIFKQIKNIKGLNDIYKYYRGLIFMIKFVLRKRFS